MSNSDLKLGLRSGPGSENKADLDRNLLVETSETIPPMIEGELDVVILFSLGSCNCDTRA
jgi:hypothetical protein